MRLIGRTQQLMTENLGTESQVRMLKKNDVNWFTLIAPEVRGHTDGVQNHRDILVQHSDCDVRFMGRPFVDFLEFKKAVRHCEA